MVSTEAWKTGYTHSFLLSWREISKWRRKNAAYLPETKTLPRPDPWTLQNLALPLPMQAARTARVQLRRSLPGEPLAHRRWTLGERFTFIPACLIGWHMRAYRAPTPFRFRAPFNLVPAGESLTAEPVPRFRFPTASLYPSRQSGGQIPSGCRAPTIPLELPILSPGWGCHRCRGGNRGAGNRSSHNFLAHYE